MADPVIPGERVFELEDATSGDGLATLYLMVDHPNFAKARKLLVASLPTGDGGGTPTGLMLADGSVPFTNPVTGVQGSTAQHLAIRGELTPIDGKADTAIVAAAAAQEDANAANVLATTAISDAAAAQATATAAMPKAGGTFTGPITHSGVIFVPAATVGGHAVNKTQLDSAISGVGGAAPSDANPQAPGTAAPGVAVTFSRADHVHPAQTVPVASNSTPQAPGTALPGTSSNFARADHVHPLQDVSALMPKAGGDFTGAVTVQTATAASHPATKSQLDAVNIVAGDAASAAATADGKAVAAQTAATVADGKAEEALKRPWMVRSSSPSQTAGMLRDFQTLGATPAQVMPDYLASGSVDGSLDFYGVSPAEYNNGDIQVAVWVMPVSTNSASSSWRMAIQRLAGGDITAAFTFSTATAPTLGNFTAFVPQKLSATILAANRNGLLAGEPFLLRITRLGLSDANNDDIGVMSFSIDVREA